MHNLFIGENTLTCLLTSLGMIGLGPMGRNLCLNLQEHDYPVAGFDPSPAAREEARAAGIQVAESLEELAREQEIFWLMMPDNAVDEVLQKLYFHADPIVIEGGNSHFRDTERRSREAAERGIRFLGMGVSGGEEGARHGACFMPGGDQRTYELVLPMLRSLAAQVEGEPCVSYMGPGGAGHFVKMVHNGIEYALMQSIAESYQVMREGFLLSPKEIQDIFRVWSRQEKLGGYLMEAAAEVLRQQDEGRPLVEVVQDAASHKGTGKWASQTAYDLGVPVPTLSTALLARFISVQKQEREEMSKVLQDEVPQAPPTRRSSKAMARAVEDVARALYSSIVASYAQGFHMLHAGSEEFAYDFNLADIATIWRGGCIIRSPLLKPIHKVYHGGKYCNLMASAAFAPPLTESIPGLRAIVQGAVGKEIPVPALSASLQYYDNYRSSRLESASLIQLLRDYFGAHGYARTDKEGTFHRQWSSDGREVRLR